MNARDLLYVLLSAAASVGALLLAWQVAWAVRGRNVSDLGVPMYEHGALAGLASLATYGTIVAAVALPRWLGPIAPWAQGSAWTVIAIVSVGYIASMPLLAF